MRALLILVFILSATSTYAQDRSPWNNKKAAVSLTYDDALNVHLDRVVPLLDSLGVKGTFYVTGNFTALKNRPMEWKPVAENGHELGNHTLFHPCIGSGPGREWVNPDYDLDDYSAQKMIDEITLTNVLLHAIDGEGSHRTLAYPCGDTTAGGESYIPGVRDELVAARGVQSKMQSPNEIDLFDIGSYMINGESGEELIKLVDEAVEKQALLVFLFHGVGGEHDLNVSAEAHRELVEYLKEREDEIWIAPLVEIAEFVKEEQ